MKFPWNIVKGWDVSSLASGAIRIQPQYVNDSIPGVFTRMRLALWVSGRLLKRRRYEKEARNDG